MSVFSVLSGFNGQEQLDFSDEGEANNEQKDSLKKRIYLVMGIEVMDFSWSGVLFQFGKKVQYRGFINNENGQLLDIIVPNKEEIVQGRCKQSRLIVITKSGLCWQFDLIHCTWLQLVLRETNSDDVLKSQHVTGMATSENILLLLTNIGQVYSYPSLITSPGIKVKQVACGFEHSVFLCDNGFVYSWGGGSRGQLGHGDIESTDEPLEVAALSGLGIVAISAGGWHTCAITSFGDVYSWGWNHHSQLGPHCSDEKSEVVSEPSLVKVPSDDVIIKSVSCGSTHTLFLFEDQSVCGCGWNKWCQLGFSDGETSISELRLLYKPSSDINVKYIVASMWSSAIICEKQSLESIST